MVGDDDLPLTRGTNRRVDDGEVIQRRLTCWAADEVDFGAGEVGHGGTVPTASNRQTRDRGRAGRQVLDRLARLARLALGAPSRG